MTMRMRFANPVAAGNGKPGAPVLDEIASVRRDIDLFSGFLTVLPNPDKIFREQPARGIRIYGDIGRDGHVRSIFQTRRLAVVGKEWEIVAASEDAADRRVRDEVEAILAKTKSFERARYNLLDGLLKGFAVGEVMWAARDGRIVPAEIRRRGQHRFAFDFDGRPRLLTLANMIDGEALPDRKFLLFQYDGDPENPYGVGLGQSLYWPWWFKKHGIKYWMIFMERFGMPLAVGKYPPSTDQATQDALLEVLRSIQQDTAVKIPNTLEIELKEAARTSTVAVYDPFIALMNAEMSKTVLGQTATTEGTPGALGSEKERGKVRDEYVAADADLLDEVITDQLIRWIVDFNFGPEVPAPSFHAKTVAEPSLDEQVQLSTRDRTLQTMGLRIPARYAYETYGIPVPEGEDEVLEPRPGAGNLPPGLGFMEADAAIAAAYSRRSRR